MYNDTETRRRLAIGRLNEITRAYENVPEGTRKSLQTPVRHKVFVSYHAVDAVEVLAFIERYEDVFIPRAIGMEEDGSDIIDSTGTEYIRRTIREKYLKDSTVTLVLIGQCTWARKFVDWEIYSSLRADPRPNGLLAVQLASVAATSPSIPERLRLNLKSGNERGYANYYVPPSGSSTLRTWIQAAFDARTTAQDQINLGGLLRQRNSSC